MLVLPVVVHPPDLFAPAARADKANLRLRDAVDASAQAQYDRIGKLVSDGPRHVLAGLLVVLLAQHLRADGVAGVVQPAVDRKPAVRHRERPEGHHCRIGRRRGPLRQVDLLRRAGRGLGRHALRHQVEDTGVGKVIGERGVEDRHQCRSLRIAAQRLEIRRGDPDALVAQVRSGMNPVLRRGGQCRKSRQNNRQK